MLHIKLASGVPSVARTAVSDLCARSQGSQDEVGHVLKLTMKDGIETTMEIAPKGELRPICDNGGCKITLEDGQFVDAKSEDIAFISKGKLEVYVP